MKNLDCSGFNEDIRARMDEYFEKIRACSFCPQKGVQFDVEDVSKFLEEDLEKELGKIAKNAVYIISSKKSFEVEQRNAYDKCKEDGFKMSRDMTGGENKNKPCCLYVGSSINDVYTRLKQHLGITESKATYALHLKHWWSDAALQITVYQFKDGIEDYALQFIEDSLWEENKPIFGRKGSK
ncbi:hypothetical protein FACS189450_01910 [Spirochaetia bacterium]|nr:hypothetical protein FACS189450_01910 [Spirochaetia bacterium]